MEASRNGENDQKTSVGRKGRQRLAALPVEQRALGRRSHGPEEEDDLPELGATTHHDADDDDPMSSEALAELGIAMLDVEPVGSDATDDRQQKLRSTAAAGLSFTEEPSVSFSMMDGAGDERPRPSPFGRRKSGPRKIAGPAGVIAERPTRRRRLEPKENDDDAPAARSSSHHDDQRQEPTRRPRRSAWLKRQNQEEPTEYPTEIPRRKRNKRVSHPTETVIDDDHNDDEGEDAVVDAVTSYDDTGHLIPAPKVRSRETGADDGIGRHGTSVKQAPGDRGGSKGTANRARKDIRGSSSFPAPVSKEVVLWKYREADARQVKTPARRAQESSSHRQQYADSYQDAKQMALRVAEGQEDMSDRELESTASSSESEERPTRQPAPSSGTAKKGSTSTPKRAAVAKVHSKVGGGHTGPKEISTSPVTTAATFKSTHTTTVNSTTTTTTSSKTLGGSTGSLFSRPGMRGKKIKIVSQSNASRRHQTME